MSNELLKSEAKELSKLKKLIKGTNIKIRRVGPANVTISGAGFNPVTRQLGGNVGIRPGTIISARKRLLKKRLKRLLNNEVRI